MYRGEELDVIDCPVLSPGTAFARTLHSAHPGHPCSLAEAEASQSLLREVRSGVFCPRLPRIQNGREPRQDVTRVASRATWAENCVGRALLSPEAGGG